MSNAGPRIDVLNTGIIFQNPKPHVRSIHAYFPSVVHVKNGEMLACMALGEAFESVDLNTNLCRSTDGGETWKFAGPVYDGTPDRITSNASRLTVLPDGGLVLFMVRHDRTEHMGEGLTNPENTGFAPTEMLLFRSKDRGHKWSQPSVIEPPLEGPAFELCSPITVLRDGRWILPTSTWHGWDGYCPNGIRMVALVSHDQGRTWPEYWNVMREPEGRTHFWESKIVELLDGRLLAVAWAYDADIGQDKPNQFSISGDGGQTWSRPRSTGLVGQTLTPFVLPGGQVLSVYRRMDTPGLWANISRVEGNDWSNDADAPLWGAQTGGLTASTANMSHNFNVLRFGAPSITALPDGTIFVAFWCCESCVSVIRWYKMVVEG